MMTKRWISLYVENQVGVLARIAGLFSSKSYNLESLTVGPTSDNTISRVTIGVMSDDATYEQIKKQLNRCVEVITVIDFTNIPIYIKELMLIKVTKYSNAAKDELFRIARVYGLDIVDYGNNGIILQSILTDSENDRLIQLLQAVCSNPEIIRSGSVAIESL